MNPPRAVQPAVVDVKDSTATWHLRLLGGFRCGNGTGEVTLTGGAVGVLTYLAVHRSPVSRSALAGLLWPEVPEQRARGNLRSALWRLSKRDHGLLDGDLSEVSIAPGTQVDYWEATAWMHRVLSGCATTADLLVDPDRFGRELVPGYDADWLCLERERLRQGWIHAVEELARSLLARGSYGKAIGAALAAIAADPLRESAHQVAIECHLAEHNITEARRAQRSYARLIEAELGIAPSPQFQHMVEHAVAPQRLVTAAG
ncbi:AfsR/SARP family transcriptional regulator [Pseudactinotalea terrae]|uniref:AfsR/SARP family transcriptional regulator n=1 Tax=Pseudactinotalea terrae TaxID=1743262 RepID=UPI0012E21A75|nr:BTAD domain-containing putative transcriptional regulator [Pseudactinotalea terrae]